MKVDGEVVVEEVVKVVVNKAVDKLLRYFSGDC